jgi:hypothetical protein
MEFTKKELRDLSLALITRENHLYNWLNNEFNKNASGRDECENEIARVAALKIKIYAHPHY